MIFPIARPSIISYLHYAHDLNIAETDPRSRQYLALEFLQLHTRVDNTGVLLVDFFSHQTNYHPSCPIISRKLFQGKDAELLGKNPVAKAIALLHAGSYVRVNLDEYHVADTFSYQQENKRGRSLPAKIRPVHFNLIYGYSAAERKFLSYGFNKLRHYDRRDISFDDFDEAYYGDDVGLWSLRLTPSDAPYPAYSANQLVNNLTGFIESRDAFQEATEATLAGRGKDASHISTGAGAFGMATYDAAVTLVELNNGKMIDIRPWCIFCDHKSSVVRLYNFLSSEKKITYDKTLLERFEFIEGDFMNLRNYLMDSTFHDRPVKIAALKRNVECLKQMEIEAITELLAALPPEASRD